MKIAMIGQKGIPATYGGIERHVEELSVRLAGRGHDVTVYCRPHYTESGGVYKGVSLKKVRSINTKHLDAISHTFFSSIDAVMAGHDIIHYHALGPSVLSFMPRSFGARVVSTIHGLDWQREKWGRFATAFLKLGEWASATFPHKTVVVSKTLKKYYDRKYSIDAAYIPNGILPPNNLPANKITEQFGLGENGYLLFVGRLVPEKGCHFLVEAFRGVDTGLKLVIAGGSSHSGGYMEELMESAKGDPRVIFTGYVYGDVLEELYSNCYLYVQPSLIEGLPIALLEALSYGKAAVISDIPENVEVIDAPGAAGPLGFTFKSGSPADLMRRIDVLKGEAALVAEAGARAREHVLKNYDWDDIAVQTEKLYSRILEG